MVAKVNASVVARRRLVQKYRKRYQELLVVERAKYEFPRCRDDRQEYNRLFSKVQNRATALLVLEYPEDFRELKTKAVLAGYPRSV